MEREDQHPGPIGSMTRKLIEIPHTVCPYTCMVNGIGDVYRWKTGQPLPNEFVMITSGMADFAYLKHKRARPPFMVFWGQSLKQQYKNLELIFGLKIEIKNGRSFNFALKLVKEEIERGNPVVIGPLDMFHLEYRTDFFHKIHVFPHFALVVGYDDLEGKIFLHDCDLPGVQPLSYGSLRLAWERAEPGYISRNAVIVFSIPEESSPLEELVRRGLLLKAEQMLNPPIRSLGVPGMRKLAEEFPQWQKLLSEEDYRLALENMAMYANTPPTLASGIDNFTGRRKEFSRLLRELAALTSMRDLEGIAERFAGSGKLISQISHIILDWLHGERDMRGEIPGLLLKIADIEEEGYAALSKGA